MQRSRFQRENLTGNVATARYVTGKAAPNGRSNPRETLLLNTCVGTDTRNPKISLGSKSTIYKRRTPHYSHVSRRRTPSRCCELPPLFSVFGLQTQANCITSQVSGVDMYRACFPRCTYNRNPTEKLVAGLSLKLLLLCWCWCWCCYFAAAAAAAVAKREGAAAPRRFQCLGGKREKERGPRETAS